MSTVMNRVSLLLAALAVNGGMPLRAQAPAGSDTLPVRHRPVANRLPVGMGQLGAIQVAQPFVYLGGQRFILGGIADAEQHLFVVADSSRTVQRLYWIQIESFLEGRTGAYNYSADSAVTVQGFPLAANSRLYATGPAPASDRAKALGLLQSLGYRIPAGAARLRLVYLPEQPARREVMIIYLEAEPGAPATVPAALTRAGSGIQLERAP